MKCCWAEQTVASRAPRRTAHLIVPLQLLEVAGTELHLRKIPKDLDVPISISTSACMLATVPSRSGEKGGLFFSSDDLASVLFLKAHTDTDTDTNTDTGRDFAYCWVVSVVVGNWGMLGDQPVSHYSGCHQLCSQGLTPRKAQVLEGGILIYREEASIIATAHSLPR